MESRILYDAPRLQLSLKRLAHEVWERHLSFDNLCVLAIQPRGVHLGRRLHQQLQGMAPEVPIPYGELDVTFHRDDFRRGAAPLVPNRTTVDFVIEDKTIILVDDVLYTGRTVRAALDAMLAFGRPRGVELLVLIDRSRMRQLPIQAFYSGMAVDTLNQEKVFVEFAESHGHDRVRIATTPQPPEKP